MTPGVHVVADSGDVLRHVARGGTGVVVLPNRLVDDDRASGALVRVLTDVTFPTSAIRAFVDGLVAIHER